MRESIHTLNIMKTGAQIAGTSKLYLHESYNIDSYYQTFNNGVRGLTRIINSLIEALNEHDHLPKYIIFIPDRDIIGAMGNFNFTIAPIIFDLCITWIIQQIEILIQRRKTDLLDRRPGALHLSIDHPSMFWVRMMKRPTAITECSKIFQMRNKFNNTLEDILTDAKIDAHILSINVPDNEFDLRGNLTSAGKVTFWRELDQAIRKYDQEKIPLLPRRQEKIASFRREVRGMSNLVKKTNQVRRHTLDKTGHSARSNSHQLNNRGHDTNRRNRSRSKNKHRRRSHDRSYSRDRRHTYHSRQYHSFYDGDYKHNNNRRSRHRSPSLRRSRKR